MDTMDTMDNVETRGMRVLLEIAKIVTDELILDQVEPTRARQIGLRAADKIRQDHGGEQLYVGKGQALLISERDREIWRDYDGTNHHAMARQHDLTVRQIYNIVARVRDEEFNRRQLGLFAAAK